MMLSKVRCLRLTLARFKELFSEAFGTILPIPLILYTRRKIALDADVEAGDLERQCSRTQDRRSAYWGLLAIRLRTILRMLAMDWAGTAPAARGGDRGSRTSISSKKEGNKRELQSI